MRCRAMPGVAMLVAALLGGCGGGGAPSGGSAPRVAPRAHPTPQFAAIADTICANANSDITALAPPGPTLLSLAAAARRELPIERLELSQLSALTARPAREAQFVAALADTRREIAIVARLVRAIGAGDPTRVQELALEGRAASATAQTAMTTLGLAACAREAEPRGRR